MKLPYDLFYVAYVWMHAALAVMHINMFVTCVDNICTLLQCQMNIQWYTMFRQANVVLPHADHLRSDLCIHGRALDSPHMHKGVCTDNLLVVTDF